MAWLGMARHGMALSGCAYAPEFFPPALPSRTEKSNHVVARETLHAHPSISLPPRCLFRLLETDAPRSEKVRHKRSDQTNKARHIPPDFES